MSADSGKPNASKQDARDQRRAAALRENLRRRKSQARARAAPRAADGTGMARVDGKQTAAQSPTRETEP
jgi:hypothetical protein